MQGMKILILNGPNLNLQGRRDVAVYGTETFEHYVGRLRAAYPGVAIDYAQSNIEGELIDAIQRAEGVYDGIVFNAGGYTHTSVSLRDAVSAAALPVVEVHISSILARSPTSWDCWRFCGVRTRRRAFGPPICSRGDRNGPARGCRTEKVCTR